MTSTFTPSMTMRPVEGSPIERVTTWTSDGSVVSTTTSMSAVARWAANELATRAVTASPPINTTRGTPGTAATTSAACSSGADPGARTTTGGR